MNHSYETEAWVLRKGNNTHPPVPGNLEQDSYSFTEINDDEVLTRPIYGCWEGNMTHALRKIPIDICLYRKEDPVVVGNSGVVQIIKAGKNVTHVKEGDICMVFANSEPDRAGYMQKALAYDSAGTMGNLAKLAKFHKRIMLPIPKNTKYSLKQWAAFSLRYTTAWANWRLAYNAYRLQMSEQQEPNPYVLAWGGGVSFAELQLAQYYNCKTAMITSLDSRINLLKDHNIEPIDRREFPDLFFDDYRMANDNSFKEKYIKSEKQFITKALEAGEGKKVAILIDNIGAPVFYASQKTLDRQAVVTTCGWKEGYEITKFYRNVECIKRHLYINTHFASYSEAQDSVTFAEENGWMPPNDFPVYNWNEIPQLGHDFENGVINSYFPLYKINEVE